MPKTIEQKVKIKCTPHDIFEAFMDSKIHSKFTESKAVISREIGGKFSAFDGSLNGENLELEQDKKIVQTWRSDEDDWPKKHFSTISITLNPIDEGTEIIFKQEDVPDAVYKSVKNGWNEYYWNPLKELLEK